MQLGSLRWQPWVNRAQAIIAWAQRYPGLIAAIGFASGLASFFFVKRQDALAQVIAVVLMLSWLWLVLEGLLRRLIKRYCKRSVPVGVLRYLTQMVHQESLFFILPFFLVTTTWQSGQMVFTGLLVLAALVAIIDPLYYRVLCKRRWLYLAYHSLALFAALLCVLPILWQLSTAQSFQIALFGSLIFALPSLASLLGVRSWYRALSVVLGTVVLGVGLWGFRSWVPPATLWLKEVSISQQLNRATRSPAEPITELSAAELYQHGLYAYSAIKAPRGLNERIYHVWQHQGKTIDTIALDIKGGREQGFRAWSHKRQFPPNAQGSWQVLVITESQQQLGRLRFEVSP